MIGSQTTQTRLRCSHLKLDDVTTPAYPFVLVSVALYASVYACVSLCVQTDTPPTDRGKAISWAWGGKWTTGRGRVNDACQNNWLPCPTQWWHHTSSDWLKMIPIQWSVFDAVPLAMYGQRWIDKSLYCATFELYQAHERIGASLCESVTTITASVAVVRYGCPRGTPSHNRTLSRGVTRSAV